MARSNKEGSCDETQKAKKHTPDRMEQQRRGRKIFRVLGRVLLTGIVLAAAVVAMTVFFKVKTISVEGAKQYGSEELIAGMDIQKGDNLYLWNKNRVLSDLMHSFPYLESAQLRRKLPDGLVLTVTECTAAAAVRNEDNTFTYISAGARCSRTTPRTAVCRRARRYAECADWGFPCYRHGCTR